MASSDQHKDIVQPSTKARLLLAFFIMACGYALWLLKTFINNIQLSRDASSAELDTAIQSLENLLDLMLIGSLILSGLMGIYFLALGYQANKSGRYPPPNFAVIRTTKIRRGAQVKISVWLCYLFAVFSWFPATVILYLKWMLAHFT
jgi:hypothetical protein